MNKLQTFFTSVLCGVSAISLMPATDYSVYVPQDADVIVRAAWKNTGTSLRASIAKVGKEIGAAETGYKK